MNPPFATRVCWPVLGSTAMTAPVPKAVRSVTYSCWFGASAMYVGREKRPPVEIWDCDPLRGFTPMIPIGKDDWFWEEKEEGPVATRIVPSAIEGSTRSSRFSSKGRREDLCVRMRVAQRLFRKLQNLMELTLLSYDNGPWSVVRSP